MKKGYAYIGDGNIMHVAKDFQTAVTYASKGTRVIETEQQYDMGYPVVNGEQIIVYGQDEMKITGDGPNIKVIPVLAELYKKCNSK